MTTFSYTLHDGCLFLWGVSLTVPCCFTWGVSLSLTHPLLVYAGSTPCAPLCWFIWGVSLTCPVLVYVGSFLHTPCWLLSLGSFSHKVYAGFFMQGISFLQTKRKNLKMNKNVHNWVMLLFKSEANIHKAPQGCIMSSSRQCWNKYKHEMGTC